MGQWNRDFLIQNTKDFARVFNYQYLAFSHYSTYNNIFTLAKKN